MTENVIEMNVVDNVLSNYMIYSTYVILERALPSIDGFKPSQRRILYTMYKMKLLSGARKKSLGVTGNTMSIHPHGDSSIYGALVNMSVDAESMTIPLIDSKGNFGKRYSRDIEVASARYTEVRLQQIAGELFKDLNKNVVDIVPSYDGTENEPLLLPVSYPSILLNYQKGIAVGMASTIFPFNINEILDFTIAFLKNKNENPLDYLSIPDFPTGGNILYNEASMKQIIETGQGSVTMVADYIFEDNSIIFDNIPYDSTYEEITDTIIKLVKNGELKEIVDINDLMGNDSKGIEVVLKKNTDKNIILSKLLKKTNLRKEMSCKFNIVDGDVPRVMGVKEIIQKWIVFRVNTIKRGLMFDINKKSNRKSLLEAFYKISKDINELTNIIKTTKNSEVVNVLIERYQLTEEQAEYVAEIKLRYLNDEYVQQRFEEIKQLEKDIEQLNNTYNSKKDIADIMISQLEIIKDSYGQERKTKIITKDLAKSVTTERIVDDYNVKIFITEQGYIKKIPLTSLRSGGEQNIKDDDRFINKIDLSNNSEILVFTDKHNVHKIKSYDIEDCKPSQLGKYIPSILELEDEEVLYITATKDFSGDLLIGYEDGKVARIAMSTYETKQNRKVLKNAYADKKALFFKHIHEDIDLVAISSIDKVLLFNTSMINSKTSKTTIGSQIQKSKNESVTIEYMLIDDFDTDDIEYYRVKSAGVGKYRK